MGKPTSESEAGAADGEDFQKLILSNTGIETLPSLSGFPSLRHLDLSQNSLTSVDALRDAKGLTWLSIADNQLDDMSFVFNLTSLRGISR